MMVRSALITWLILFALIGALLSLFTGPAGIQIGEALSALFGDNSEVYTIIMREIRLPRVLLSLTIGFALGISGAAMQGFMRNPLAEPGILGISASAALGAVIALQTGITSGSVMLGETVNSQFTIFILPLCAMLGALLSAALLFLFGETHNITRLILVGIGLSALSGALTSLVLNLSPNPFAATDIVFWLMGSVSNRSMTHVIMALPFITIGSMLILSLSRGLDALSLGEDTAQSLGFSLKRFSVVLITSITLLVGASVAVAGAIAFIGLIVPHMLRRFTGVKPSLLLLPSGIGGAALLTFADVLTRLIAPERDLKLGVITALIGAPIFIHIIMRGDKLS